MIESTWKPGEPVSLFGRRVEVRTARVEDLPHYERWAQEDSVARFVWSPTGDPGEVWQRMLASNDNRSRFVLTILHRRDRRPIGFFRLACDLPRGVMIPTIAIGEPHYRGGKIAIEASSAVYDFAFAHLPVQTIERHVYGDNERILHVLKGTVSMHESGVHEENGRKVRSFSTSKDEWQRDAPGLHERTALLPDAELPPEERAAWKPGEPLELTSERLSLRSLHANDVSDALVAWTEQGPVGRHVWFSPGDRKHVLRETARLADNDRFFCLLVREHATGHVRGLVRLTRYPDPKNLILGLALDPRGDVPPLANEVLLTICDFFLSNEWVETVEFRVYAKNKSVARRLERLGFPLRDIEPERRDGQQNDVCVFVATHYQWLGIAENIRAQDRRLLERAARNAARGSTSA